MDKVTAVRKRLNREQWKSLISECRSSGMTVSRWCKENNICEQTYYKNLKKLREEMMQGVATDGKCITDRYFEEVEKRKFK